jgi:hypothetical protein
VRQALFSSPLDLFVVFLHHLSRGESFIRAPFAIDQRRDSAVHEQNLCDRTLSCLERQL